MTNRKTIKKKTTSISPKASSLRAKKSSSSPKPVPKTKSSNDSFFDSVFQVARLIPKGRVSTYGAIAKYLGTKLSARMVGWAMNAAGTSDKPVPAHRVVNRNGMLSGKHHFATPTLMEERLLKEKIKVENDKVVDFEKLFWDPAELEI